MSYSYRFSDNSEYGAEDLNDLVKSLVSSGVADVFSDGVPYNASILNGVVSAAYLSGVVPTDVSTLAVTKLSSGVVQIAPGTAFFADGSTITVTEAEKLSYVPGVKHYVYLKQDLTAQNRNYPACTADAPTGDFVLLAEIAADETVTDKRSYAKGKVPGYQSNANISLEAEQSISFEAAGTKSFTMDLGTNNYSRVFVVTRQGDRCFGGIGMYNFTDGSYFSTYNMGYRGAWSASDKDIVVLPCEYRSDIAAYSGNLTLSKNGNTLTGSLVWSQNHTADFRIRMIFC